MVFPSISIIILQLTWMLLLSLPSAIYPLLRRLGCCLAFVSSSSSCSCSSSSSSSCQFPLGSKATRQQEKNTILLTHCVYLRPVKKFLFVLTNLCLVFSCMACWCAWENSVSFCVYVCLLGSVCVCVCVFVCVGVCLCVDDALKCYLQLVTYFMRLCFWRKKKNNWEFVFFFSFFFAWYFFFELLSGFTLISLAIYSYIVYSF